MPKTNGDKRNQQLYREVNKRIREVTGLWDADGATGFLCECGQEDCTATFELTQAQFDAFSSDDSRILLAARHKGSLQGQRILAEHDGFLVVVAEAEPAATSH